MAFELFHERGMNYTEIALQLDCPVGTVKTWVHRARSRLIDQLLDREVVAKHPRGTQSRHSVVLEKEVSS